MRPGGGGHAKDQQSDESYVAERFKQRVRRFSPTGKKKGTFIDGLPDMPEFLVHVPDRAAGAVPPRV